MRVEFCREFNSGGVRYEIVEHLGVLATNHTGWTKELNIVAWDGGEPKYDIREWDEAHERMTRGITLTSEELAELAECVLQEVKGGVK